MQTQNTNACTNTIVPEHDFF